MYLLLETLVLISKQKPSANQKEALINTLRALANLCYDFGIIFHDFYIEPFLLIDENRDDILACDGGMDAIVSTIDTPDAKIMATAYKAILNISMDNGKNHQYNLFELIFPFFRVGTICNGTMRNL